LEEKTRATVLKVLESLLVEGAEDRQWHCAELAEELSKAVGASCPRLDKYQVNAILRETDVAVPLGRLVWTRNARGASGTDDRIDIGDLCAHALLQAGRPLTTAELRKAVEHHRGLGETFLPHANTRMARLGRGLWGLRGRDIVVDEAESQQFLSLLEQTLRTYEVGIHANDLLGTIQQDHETNFESIDAGEAFALVQSDKRFRVRRGDMVHLA
jgi:hypothetical protein